jgi:large subunit ribosomal protein L22
MQFVAKSRHIRHSPYKLRMLVDVIRGKKVSHAIGWLDAYAVQKSLPIKKLIASAAANAKYLKNVDAAQLVIKSVRVDAGPMYRYYKPSAMGRANIYKRRSSHISVMLEQVDLREE